jgi:hypothetical protein
MPPVQHAGTPERATALISGYARLSGHAPQPASTRRTLRPSSLSTGGTYRRQNRARVRLPGLHLPRPRRHGGVAHSPTATLRANPPPPLPSIRTPGHDPSPRPVEAFFTARRSAAVAWRRCHAWCSSNSRRAKPTSRQAPGVCEVGVVRSNKCVFGKVGPGVGTSTVGPRCILTLAPFGLIQSPSPRGTSAVAGAISYQF